MVWSFGTHLVWRNELTVLLTNDVRETPGQHFHTFTPERERIFHLLPQNSWNWNNNFSITFVQRNYRFIWFNLWYFEHVSGPNVLSEILHINIAVLWSEAAYALGSRLILWPPDHNLACLALTIYLPAGDPIQSTLWLGYKSWVSSFAAAALLFGVDWCKRCRSVWCIFPLNRPLFWILLWTSNTVEWRAPRPDVDS